MSSEEDRRIWTEASEAWVDFVRTGKDICRLYINNPAMLEALGDIRGKRLIDIACGEGYNTRLMAERGAIATGVDFSETMVRMAQEEAERVGLRIDHRVADASDLGAFDDGSFDIATCFMAVQDIADIDRAFREAARVLADDGRFVFVIPHPCFETRFEGKVQKTGWVYRDETKPHDSANAIHYTVDRYFDSGRYLLHWEMPRLSKPFVTSSYNRTLTEYSQALAVAGFRIASLREPLPTEEGLRLHKDSFERDLRIPLSLLFECVKR